MGLRHVSVSGEKYTYYYNDLNDAVYLNNYIDLAIYSNGGEDTIVTSATTLFVDSGTGADDITVRQSENAQVYAGSGNDTVSIESTANSAVVEAGDGNDVVYFKAASGTVNGWAGNDILHAYLSNTLVNGGDGNDTIVWHGGEFGITETLDRGELVFLRNVNGGSGVDTLVLAEDATWTDISLLMAVDDIENAVGNNQANGIGGTFGNNNIEGKGGDDVIIGQGGFDYLSGGDGNDRLVQSGTNASTLHGGAGNDTLSLSYNSHGLGSWGEDIFTFDSDDLRANRFNGRYIYIDDFEQGYDKIRINAGDSFTIAQSSPGVYLLSVNGNTSSNDPYSASISVTMRVGSALRASDIIIG